MNTTIPIATGHDNVTTPIDATIPVNTVTMPVSIDLTNYNRIGGKEFVDLLAAYKHYINPIKLRDLGIRRAFQLASTNSLFLLITNANQCYVAKQI